MLEFPAFASPNAIRVVRINTPPSSVISLVVTLLDACEDDSSVPLPLFLEVVVVCGGAQESVEPDEVPAPVGLLLLCCCLRPKLRAASDAS